jgi:hypothetical protein
LCGLTGAAMFGRSAPTVDVSSPPPSARVHGNQARAEEEGWIKEKWRDIDMTEGARDAGGSDAKSDGVLY